MRKVRETISDKLPIEDEALKSFVTRELALVVRRLRDSVNQGSDELTSLTASIAAETLARIAADSAEATTRAAEDSALDARVDALESATLEVVIPVIWKAGGITSTTTPIWMQPYYINGLISSTSESAMSIGWNVPGTFRNFRVHYASLTGTDADLVVWTLRKNGVDTALTVTRDALTTGIVSDTTHSVAVELGDLISVGLTFPGAAQTAATSITVSWEFVPS